LQEFAAFARQDVVITQRNTVSNGVPLVALFGGESTGLVKPRVRTMLRVAPAATTDGRIGFWGAFPGGHAMELQLNLV